MMILSYHSFFLYEMIFMIKIINIILHIMKYIKRFLSEEEHSSYVKDNFFNYQQNIKKLINIVDNNNLNIIDVRECDAEYEFHSNSGQMPVSLYSVGPSYQNGMLLTHYAEYFKSFKVNGYELITEEGQSGDLYLTNIFDDSLVTKTYVSPEIKIGLNPSKDSFITFDSSESSNFIIELDRELTKDDSIVCYRNNYYMVFSYDQNYYEDFYSNSSYINDEFDHEEGTTIYTLKINKYDSSSVLQNFCFVGVSNKNGLINSKNDIIPTKLKLNDVEVDVEFNETFIPSTLAFENRFNDEVKLKISSGLHNLKLYFENGLTNDDSIIIYLFNMFQVFPKNEEIAPFGDIIYPNVSVYSTRATTPTFSYYFKEIDENTYELTQDFIEMLLYYSQEFNYFDLNFYGLNKNEYPSSIDDFIPCTIQTEEAKTLDEGVYYANFEYVDNINDYLDNNDGFFRNTSISKVNKSAFRNLIKTSKYMFYLCPNLKEVDFGLNLNEINAYTFYNCDKLTSLDIPSNIKKLNNYGICRCFNITSVTFNDGLEYIGSYNLWQSNVEEIKIPKTVTYIDYFGLRRISNTHVKVSVDEGNPVYDSRNNCNGIVETAYNGVRWGYQDTNLIDNDLVYLQSAFTHCDFDDGFVFKFSPLQQSGKAYAFDFTNGKFTFDASNFKYKHKWVVGKSEFHNSSVETFYLPKEHSMGVERWGWNSDNFRNSNLTYFGDTNITTNTDSFNNCNLKEIKIYDNFEWQTRCIANTPFEKMYINRTNDMNDFGTDEFTENHLRYIETNTSLNYNYDAFGTSYRWGVMKPMDDFKETSYMSFIKHKNKTWKILDDNDGLTCTFRVLKDCQWVVGSENIITCDGLSSSYNLDGTYSIYFSNLDSDSKIYREFFLNGESLGKYYITNEINILLSGDNSELYKVIDLSNEDTFNQHIVENNGAYVTKNGLTLSSNTSNCIINTNRILTGILNVFSSYSEGPTYSTIDGTIISIVSHDGYKNTKEFILDETFNIKIVGNSNQVVSLCSLEGYQLPEYPSVIETEVINKFKLIKDSIEITSLGENETLLVDNTPCTYNNIDKCWECKHNVISLESSLNYNNGEFLATLDNMSNNVEYFFIGEHNQDYSEINIVAKITGNTNSTTSYRLINSLKCVKAMLVDGKQIVPTINYTFENNTSHTISYIYDTDNMKGLTLVFRGCSSLNEIEFKENFDTSNLYYMRDTFYDCTNLKVIKTHETFDTSKVIKFVNTFRNCYYLTEVTNIDKWDFSSAEMLTHMFHGCQRINLDPSNWNVDNVQSMYGLFRDCYNLYTDLDLSKWNTSNVTTMAYMFYECRNVNNITLSDSFITDKVGNMERMFGGCNKLKSINLSNFNTSNVINMHYMFECCYDINDIDLSSFTFEKCENMEYMFRNCTSLTSVTLTNEILFEGIQRVSTNVGEMFSGITTIGVLNYTNEYDYSPIINTLPPTWNAYYPNQSVTNKINLIVDGIKIKKLNEGDSFTINGNKLTFNENIGYWEYKQNVSNWKSFVKYNDYEYHIYSNVEKPQNF